MYPDFPANRRRGAVTAEEQEIEIFKAYPRPVARIAALKAIEKAVAYLVKNEGLTPLEARRTLYRATVEYSRSPDGQNPDKTKIPHPATWYNRGSYLDDPQEWQHGGFNHGSLPKSKADRNLGVLAKIINEGKRTRSDGEDGELQAGQRGRDNAQILLPRA
jgi:hypothetical protein